MLIRFLDRLRKLVFGFLRLRTIGSVILAVDDGGSVLLVRQSYGSPAWSLPGGGVRRYETVRAAALREAKEEVGLSLREGGTAELLGIYLKRRGGWSDQVCVFVVRGWDLTPMTNWEIAEVRSFHPDDLPPDIAPAVRRRIDEWRGLSPVDERW